jgi:hypothetical protein
MTKGGGNDKRWREWQRYSCGKRPVILTQNFLEPVIPVWIVGFDQFDFPGPIPFFDLFLASNGCVHFHMQLIPDEPIHIVLLGKSINELVFVLPDSLRQIRGNPNVEHTLIFTGENINRRFEMIHDFVLEVEAPGILSQ